MRVSFWNEGEFMQILNSGLYEDLIHQCEQWMEWKNVISRTQVPSDQNYETTRRYAALKVIAMEGHTIWEYDSSGFYSSYGKILERIEEKRKKGILYDVSKLKAKEDAEKKKLEEEKNKQEEEKRRWQNEAKRVQELREYCASNQLDFDEENTKALQTMKAKSQLAGWLEFLGVIAFFGGLIMWIFTNIGNWLVWVPVIITGIVLFCVVDDKLDPKLPDDYFKKIKDGRYRFDL